MNPAKFQLPKSGTSSPGQFTTNLELLPIRVIDIILDSSHPEYTKYGGVESIGCIKYSLIDRKILTDESNTLPVAFPLNRNFTNYPLKNEIVFIVKGPRNDTSPRNNKFLERVDYYLSPISIFNNVNSNPFSDPNYIDPVDNLSFSSEESFTAKDSIRPLQPFNGDTIIEGRNGQSIRFTGAKSKNNPFVDSSNIQAPLTIITNGHEDAPQNSLYVENINKDDSSIYLASDHTIPLKQSKLKYAGANERPISADKYKGKQIVVNSGRLFLNSSTEDIQFSCTTDFGITAKIAYIDAEDYIGLDAKKIYLGERARREETEPVILGDKLEQLLRELLDALQRTGSAMKKAKVIDGKPIPLLNVEGTILEQIVKGLNNRINPGGKSTLKSRKTFTE